MGKKIFCLALNLVLLSLFASESVAQVNQEIEALKQEVERLREGHERLQRAIDETKNLIKENGAPSATPINEATLSVDGYPFKGQMNAPVTLVEFSDYQCPFCARYLRQTFPEIYKEYIETGKVKYVFRDFPIRSIHPHAHKAHEAAHCAGEQGKYWEMHDGLFANQKSLGPKALFFNAEALSLDGDSFQQCLDLNRHAQRIDHSILEGRKAGVRGTPTFFLGYTDTEGGKVTAVRLMRGAYPYTAFKQAIDSLLGNLQK